MKCVEKSAQANSYKDEWMWTCSDGGGSGAGRRPPTLILAEGCVCSSVIHGRLGKNRVHKAWGCY